MSLDTFEYPNIVRCFAQAKLHGILKVFLRKRCFSECFLFAFSKGRYLLGPGFVEPLRLSVLLGVGNGKEGVEEESFRRRQRRSFHLTQTRRHCQGDPGCNFNDDVFIPQGISRKRNIKRSGVKRSQQIEKLETIGFKTEK